MEQAEIAAALEAILFVAGDAVERRDVLAALEITDIELDAAVHALESEYDYARRGFKLMRFDKKLQLATRAEYTPYVERVLAPRKKQTLTQSAMETLAVIAYRQPCTRGDIENVRGVRCDYTVRTLLAHGLIREAGRRDAVGRPVLYETTEEFLRHFGLNGLEDLPALLAPDAGEDGAAGEGISEPKQENGDE